MHTFFINTSENKFHEYEILLDIQSENRKLVSLDCFFADWFSEEAGYKSCVRNISGMIDAYAELDNAFQLVVYIDLAKNEKYLSISRNIFGNKEREACLIALRTLYSHVIGNTIVKEFARTVRCPRDVLILFGEDTKIELEHVVEATPGASDIYAHIATFIGMPEEKIVTEIAKKVDSENHPDKISVFAERMSSAWEKEIVPGIRDLYTKEFSFWYDQIMMEANVEEATRLLYQRIMHYDFSGGLKPEMISCPRDCGATNNKCAETLNQLNVILHLLKCVATESIYRDSQKHTLHPYYAYTPQEIAELLRKKQQLFSQKLEELQNPSGSYSDLLLAPVLFDFDYRKFCLNEFGEKATDFVFSPSSAVQTQEATPKEASKTDDEAEDAEVRIDGTTTTIRVVQANIGSLFTSAEYQPFQYIADCENGGFSLKTPHRQFLQYGIQIKQMHMDFLNKLKFHISERLSNYAGKSIENKPALLRMGEYHYTTKKAKETKALETVKKISKKAYTTTLERYMEFSAGRPVSVTDISRFCDLYISRIQQIQVSLARTGKIALGAFLGLLVLLLPFFIVQRSILLQNDFTFLCCLISLLLPCAILGFSFSKALAEQKRKYLKEHDALRAESDRIISENADVAQKYDQLLSSVIPSLRWMYEYMLDVSYYADRCRVADAKLEHHKVKLRERIHAIANILSDLECGDTPLPASEQTASGIIDYNCPFCSGKQNILFYTVADQSFFDTEQI